MLKLTKMYGFLMDMFNCDDVDTMLMKRRQKLFDGYEHLENFVPNNHIMQL